MTDPAAHENAGLAPLSPAGRARRDAMLIDLQREVVRSGASRRRRRTAVRAAAGVGAAAIALCATILLAHRAPKSALPPTRPTADASPRKGDGLPPIQLVRTDASLVSSLMVRNADIDMSAVRIDDAELLRDLAEAGRPTGLVRSQGRVWCTEPVTDAERAALIPSSG